MGGQSRGGSKVSRGLFCPLSSRGTRGTRGEDACWVSSLTILETLFPELAFLGGTVRTDAAIPKAHRNHTRKQRQHIFLAFSEQAYRKQAANSYLAEWGSGMQLRGRRLDGDWAIPIEGRREFSL